MLRIHQARQSERTAAIALFERELAFYRADAPYLSVEKCAERCERLSAILAAVAILQGAAVAGSTAVPY
ncbi:hypothetical protein KF840_19400 [bacterium]|nr:hypothetical protein [bacterium]